MVSILAYGEISLVIVYGCSKISPFRHVLRLAAPIFYVYLPRTYEDDAKVMFSACLSFCSQGGGGGTRVKGAHTRSGGYSAKKVLTPGEGRGFHHTLLFHIA